MEQDKARGCLLGLALGDALGRPVERHGDLSHNSENRHAEASDYISTFLCRMNEAMSSTLMENNTPVNSGHDTAHTLYMMNLTRSSSDFTFGQVTEDTQIMICLARALTGGYDAPWNARGGGGAGAGSGGRGFIGGGTGQRFSRSLVKMFESGRLLGLPPVMREAMHKLKQGFIARQSNNTTNSSNNINGLDYDSIWKNAGDLLDASNGAGPRAVAIGIAFRSEKLYKLVEKGGTNV